MSAVQQLDLIEQPLQISKGFRLAHLEVFNWGTFDQKIWQLSPEQQNSLLTGNIGSGKSTIIDGLTTLLVPPKKLAFNKAAGAEQKERSLESYFHGFYTSQQDGSGKARSVGLRQNKHYSVLLARFHSSTLEETLTLAQVFWLKSGETKVKRLYVVAHEALSIQDDFSDFGSQILQLRKKLRKNDQVQLFDNFSPYAHAFSKLMGLGSDGKALELFNQTISMKSVGSVTDFVRQNMLESPDIKSHIAKLESNYDDLKRLHDAVVAARHKVALLNPVVQYGKQATDAERQKQEGNFCRDAIDAYIARKSVQLYDTRLQKRQQELDKLTIRLDALKEEKALLDQQIVQLKNEIYDNGGGRLQQLESDIQRYGKDRDQRQKVYGIYQKLVLSLDLSDQLNVDQFLQNIGEAGNLLDQQTELLNKLDDEIFSLRQQLDKLTEQQQAISTELNALKKRKSNLPIRQLELRQRLCEMLELDEDQLPFVGELLRVKPDHKHWEGAIERVMHNFALSLVVPDALYQQVSDLVDRTHLGGRLVYYRVKSDQYRIEEQPASDSLPSRIEIKPDCVHYDWLQNEINRRFNYQCCDDLADFRRSEKAITAKGQIKSGKFRHEKDDRHDINDKRRFVLGWSNKQKIELLTAQLSQLKQQADQQKIELEKIGKNKNNQESLRHTANNLANFEFEFEQINWPQISETISQLQQEKQTLEQSSDVLLQIRQRLADAEDQIKSSVDKFDQTNREVGSKQAEIENDQTARLDNQKVWQSLTDEKQAAYFPLLDKFVQKYFADKNFNLREISTRSTELKKKLNDKIQHLQEKINKKEQQMVAAMSDFAHAYPNDVTELDKSRESLPEYTAMLNRLENEDLPRHEERFKDMLNRDTIRAMALFRSQLDKLDEDIDARIHLINKALRGLEYQQGTYIEIDRIASSDVDVRDFKTRLKQCVEYATDNSLYSEEKFVRVKDLIEQMRNEPKWTQKVVDVRYWHLFNVVERYKEDNSEKECYSDSGGKSGGQKEKLAYSILAAAILLQYRLMDDQYHLSHAARRRFNLVVIDEAFGRGSKDSTRFGLELFKQLGLQLLLVTPLQKLDVIEHYVQHVHFVDQQDNRSILLNMTIKEYQDKMQQHKLDQIRLNSK